MAPTPESPAPTPESLERCVGDFEAFLADCYTRRLHLWHGAGFDDLLSLSDVDHQLTGAGLRRPYVRVVADGVPVDPSAWTREARTGAIRTHDLVDPGRLLDLFANGSTIVLQSLQRWWAPLTRFCRELENTLGHAVQANAYLTPAGAAGLSPHHDTHDVFVIQLFGHKQWTVRQPLIEAPLARQHSDHEAAARQPVMLEAELHPGDCLYLPRGLIHSAATQNGTSLHLTIGVLATTVHDVLQRLVDRAADEETFRKALPPGFPSTIERRATLKAIIADFSSWLDAIDLDRATEEDIEALTAIRTHRMPILEGHLLALTQLADLGDHTVVAARDHRRQPREADGFVLLDTGDRRLELPAALGPALQRLLDGAPHQVRELADLLDTRSRLVLVRRLVREGVLRLFDGP